MRSRSLALSALPALFLVACGEAPTPPPLAPPAPAASAKAAPAPTASASAEAAAEAPKSAIDDKREPLKLSPGSADPKKGEEANAWRYIVVDQFGYRPEMKKVAVLVDPEDGYNGKDDYKPGSTFEVRTWADGKVVFSGKPTVWNDGKVQKNAGDRGWWFDFSALKEPGSYFVFDKDNRVRSHKFEIGKDVYRDVLKAAMRMFYFNRANFEKKKPFACVGDKCWEQGRDFVGPGQDGEARSIRAKDDPKTARDLTGGWWDAGDVNKYITFAHNPVHQLLTAYQEKPKAFTDDTNIPESKNGIPDILDELKYELDWMMKMQPKDLGGGVLIKMGNKDHGGGEPATDKQPRFYYPEPCSASTIAASGMFAHASIVLSGVPKWKAYAADLKKRAIDAWKWYGSHERSTKCDDGSIKAGGADWSLDAQDAAAAVAGVYLFALTGDQKYEEALEKNLPKTRAFADDRWSAYDPPQGEALLFYAGLPKAKKELVGKILDQKKKQAKDTDIYLFRPEQDLYLAFLRDDSYHWGSNMPRANYGVTVYEMIQYKLAADADRASYEDRAAGLLHSFHGVNPLGLVYLTNMNSYGAEESASEIFHTWFHDGNAKFGSAKTSSLGPAPGYVPGGPNHDYCKWNKDHKCYGALMTRQPSQKAYIDFNTGWAPDKEYDSSWELTEPAIYYQASYVTLLSKFVD